MTNSNLNLMPSEVAHSQASSTMCRVSWRNDCNGFGPDCEVGSFFS